MDVAFLETGNGGDVQLRGRDLAMYFGWENMPYLALFGGNVEASSKGKKLPNEQAFDYWGNNLLFPNNESIQFNSLTERALSEVALNSSGRIKIEQVIKQDISFMNEFAEVTVATAIISDDKLLIDIRIKRPDNLEDKRFIYIWDATNESIANVTLESLGLQNELQYNF